MNRKLGHPGLCTRPVELFEQAGNDTAKVTVCGEVDVATAPPLEELLIDTMNRPSPIIEVDLGNVSFMDASGLTALIRADDKARHVGGRLYLSHVPERVARLLKIFDLDRRFSILA
ncbi:STAS domain-containing protein [Nonomuraea sp. NPDC049480]|uniref:STAS domain-containing protein n=1 Tax=Nonomuraea sp. NPDC049480 TaxID=3364353 RepID=UPI0037BA8BD1